MHKKTILFFGLCLLAGSFLRAEDSAPPPSIAKRQFQVDRVVAIVNDEAITMTDLQRSLVPLIKQLKSQYSGLELRQKLDEAGEQVLNQLIDNKLILRSATNLKEKDELKIPEKEISKYVQKIIDRFPSQDVFQEMLKQENLSLEDFKKDCTEQLLVKKLVQKEVSSRVLVSNEEIRKYYADHLKDYTSAAKITFSQIWIKKEGDIEAKKTLIKDIKKKLSAGGDFKALAVQYSEDPHAKEGGVWKNVEKGQFTPELDDMIWKLSPGQESEIIETSVGFHLVKVDVIEKPRVVPINEVWEDIQDTLYFERAEQIRKEWISRLRKDAYIQIFYEKS